MHAAKMQELQRRLRRYGWKKGTLHALDEAQAAVLRQMTIADFFSAPFIEKVMPRRYVPIGVEVVAARIVHVIGYVWPEALTVADLMAKCRDNCNRLAMTPGFGQSCIELFFNIFAVFGIEMKLDPDALPADEPASKARIQALTERLGIK